MRVLTQIIIIILISLCLQTKLNAQSGSEFKINSYTTSEQHSPKIAQSANTGYVVVWSSLGQDGSGEGIYAQRYNAVGAPQGNEFLVNSTTNGDQTNPDVAMDQNGNFVIVWQSYSQDFSATQGVYMKRYNANGAAINSETRVNSTVGGDQDKPKIAMNKSGNFIITWQSDGQDGSGTGIYAKSFNSSGGVISLEVLVNTTTIGNQTNPDVSIDGNSNFYITWESDGQDGSGLGIYQRKFNSAGSPLTAETLVNTNTTGNQQKPTISVNHNGKYVITWESNHNSSNGYDICFQKYSSSGTKNGSETIANTTTTGDQTHPSVIIDEKDGFSICWTDPSLDGQLEGVFFQNYNTAGTVGTQTQINTTTNNAQTQPMVASDSIGNYTYVWTSNIQDGNNNGIYCQRYGNIFPQVNNPTFSVNENTAAATVIGTLTASDLNSEQTLSYTITGGNTGNIFSINAFGVITLTDIPNYENKNSYTLTIEVTDNGIPSRTSISTTKININNVNEAPVATNKFFNVIENSSIGMSAGLALASDPDIGQSISYAIINGNTNNTFSINSSGYVVIANVPDYETTSTYSLTIRATDNGSPTLYTDYTVTILIINLNENPVVSSKTYTVPENATIGTIIGTIDVSDPDANQTLTFFNLTSSITAFKINNKGEISLNSILDFETTNTYTMNIQVFDNGSPSKSGNATIIINVTDVDENAPTTSNFKIIYNNTDINVYPNPANDFIQISNLADFEFIEIKNNIGQSILKSEAKSSINISQLNNGYYIIEINTKNKKIINTFIKN